MTNLVFHPLTGERVDIMTLKSDELRIPNRLYKPTVWKEYYSSSDVDLDQTRLFGLEFEFNVAHRNHQPLDYDRICREILMLLNKDGHHCHLMVDNSVRSGIEIVFAPMSYNYIVETFDFESVFKIFSAFDLVATHDTGFHMHVNIEHTLRERNLILRLFSISYPLWLELSRRNISRLQERYVSTEFFTMNHTIRQRYIHSLDRILHTGTSKVSFNNINFENYDIRNRYNALNFANKNTVEFRLFNGMSDVASFYEVFNYVVAFIELVDTISVTRIDEIFTLDQFVHATQSHSLLQRVETKLKKANRLLERDLMYFNAFYFMNTYWYPTLPQHAKKGSYIIHKKHYEDYISMYKRLQSMDPVKAYHDRIKLMDEMSDYLMDKTYEVVMCPDDFIDCVPIINSTFITTLSYDKLIEDYVVLNCINRDFLLSMMDI